MCQGDFRIGPRISRVAAVDARAAVEYAFARLEEGLINPEAANARRDFHDVRDVVGSLTIHGVFAQTRISGATIDNLAAERIPKGGLVARGIRNRGCQGRLNVVIEEAARRLEGALE